MKRLYALSLPVLCGLFWPGLSKAQVCTSPGTTLYGLNSSGNIYPIATSNANVSAKITPAYANPAPNQANAIGYNAINGLFYYFKINPGTGSQAFISFNPTTNTYTTLTNSPTASSVHSGCVTNDGKAYYCTDVIGKLYYYSIALNTWTTITNKLVDQFGVNVSAIIGSQTSGDMAMDGDGDLWILPSSASQYGLYKVSAPVPTTAQATVSCSRIINATTVTPTGNAFEGMAFSSTGQVYLSTGDDKLYTLSASLSLSLIGTFNTSGVGNDMTSCSFPMTVLPVVWQSFTAQLQNDGEVELDWTVTAQVNDKGYTVEYSEDGINWKDLAFIDAAGNDRQALNYSYLQQNPATGKNYYRVREVDFNGLTSYSEIRMIEIQSNPANVAITCWPNPAKDLLNIRTTGNNLQGASIRIFDRSGNLMLQNVWSGETGSINISMLPAGLYIVHIQSVQGALYNTKLMKQ